MSMIDEGTDPNNLSEDDIKKLMASGVDMSQIAALRRKASNAHDDLQGAMATLSTGMGGKTVNGLYLGDTAGALVAGLRGYKARKEEDSDNADVKRVMDQAKESAGDYVNKGVLGRTGLPTEADSIDPEAGQVDTSAAASANPMAPPPGPPQGAPPPPTGGPPPPAPPSMAPQNPASVQMMQALALRAKKKAATPGNYSLNPDINEPDNYDGIMPQYKPKFGAM